MKLSLMPVNRKPCQPCRNRKTKCDGDLPECGTCKRRGKNVCCKYDDPSDIEPVRAPRGSAKTKSCKPCQQKKKRCTNKRPCCDACQKSGIQDQCTYPYSVQSDKQPREWTSLRKLQPANSESKSRPIAHARPSSSSSVSPPHRKSRNTRPRILPSIREFMSSTASSPSPPSSSSLVSPLLRNSRSPEPGILPSIQDLLASIAPYNRHPPASFTHFRPSLDLKLFIRILLPLSSDPRSFAVSEVSRDDMNIYFRFVFLDRRLQLGFYLSDKKVQAILRGNISNSVIHPFFVHYATAYGCLLYKEYRKDPSFLHTLCSHMQLAWEALASMREEDDPLLLAQAYHYLFFGFLHGRSLTPGKRFLRRSATIVKKYGIRFVPISSSDASIQSSTLSSTVPPFSDDVWERAVLLAKLVYSEIHLQLITGQSDGVCDELEAQFRKDLPATYPALFDMCPIIMRVRSVLFVKDANQIMAAYKQHDGPGDLLEVWMTRFKSVIELLSNNINHLASRMTAFSEDHNSSLSIRYSMIICFTAKADLCRTITGIRLLSSVDRQHHNSQCEDSLRCVVQLTEGLDPDDFNFLDPFLGICWSRAMKLLLDTSCLALPSGSDDEHADKRVIIITRSKKKLDVIVTGPPPNCDWLADINIRRKPGVPNYLREDVRVALGL